MCPKVGNGHIVQAKAHGTVKRRLYTQLQQSSRGPLHSCLKLQGVKNLTTHATHAKHAPLTAKRGD